MHAALVKHRIGYHRQERDHTGPEDVGHDRQKQRLLEIHERRQNGDLTEHVQNADADDDFVRFPALLQVRVFLGRNRVVGGPDAHVAEQADDRQLFEQGDEKRRLAHGEVEPVAAGLQLGNIRIVSRVIDELVMGEMLQAIVLRRPEKRKHAAPIGHEIVAEAVLEERVVGGLMGEAGELMLTRADQDDREKRDGNVPRPRQIPANG